MKKLTILMSLVLTCSLATADFLYNFTALGELQISASSRANSINNDGQIVGFSSAPFSILFDAAGNGNNIWLGSLDSSDLGNQSKANAINNNGQIVGYAANNGGTFPTLFDSTGNHNNINLGTLGSKPFDTSSHGEAMSINDNRLVVGWSRNSSQHDRATLFDATGYGYNTDLGTLGGNTSKAWSINNNGQIVGFSLNASGNYEAAVFDQTGNQNNIGLGTLGGDYSIAYSVNDSGSIVGAARGVNFSHATLFDSTGNGENIDLGTLGGIHSAALSINVNGDIVGYALDESGNQYATLFDSTGNGNNINLETLISLPQGWTLLSANDINDNDWIVGYGINSDGYKEAFLLTPIPEPATLLLLGFGGLALRRKK